MARPMPAYMRNNPYSTQVRYNVWDPANPYAAVSNFHPGFAAPMPHKAGSTPSAPPCQNGGACQCGGKCGEKAASAGGCGCSGKNANSGAAPASSCGEKASSTTAGAIALVGTPAAAQAPAAPASVADQRAAAFAAMASSPNLAQAYASALNSSFFTDTKMGQRAARAVMNAGGPNSGALGINPHRSGQRAMAGTGGIFAPPFATRLNSYPLPDGHIDQKFLRQFANADGVADRSRFTDRAAYGDVRTNQTSLAGTDERSAQSASIMAARHTLPRTGGGLDPAEQARYWLGGHSPIGRRRPLGEAVRYNVNTCFFHSKVTAQPTPSFQASAPCDNARRRCLNVKFS